jgi:hypothetical protein
MQRRETRAKALFGHVRCVDRSNCLVELPSHRSIATAIVYVALDVDVLAEAGDAEQQLVRDVQPVGDTHRDLPTPPFCAVDDHA